MTFEGFGVVRESEFAELKLIVSGSVDGLDFESDEFFKLS